MERASATKVLQPRLWSAQHGEQHSLLSPTRLSVSPYSRITFATSKLVKQVPYGLVMARRCHAVSRSTAAPKVVNSVRHSTFVLAQRPHAPHSISVVSLHAKMANNRMFYACHDHDCAKASVMHRWVLFSNILLVDDIIL